MSIVHLLVQVYQMGIDKKQNLSNLLCVCFIDYDQVVQTHNETCLKRENVIDKLFKIVLNFYASCPPIHTPPSGKDGSLEESFPCCSGYESARVWRGWE